MKLFKVRNHVQQVCAAIQHIEVCFDVKIIMLLKNALTQNHVPRLNAHLVVPVVVTLYYQQIRICIECSE